MIRMPIRLLSRTITKRKLLIFLKTKSFDSELALTFMFTIETLRGGIKKQNNMNSVDRIIL